MRSTTDTTTTAPLNEAIQNESEARHEENDTFATTFVVVYVSFNEEDPMSAFTHSIETPEQSADERLAIWGLSTSLIHDALREGFARSRGRSALAPSPTPAMDVYGDGFETLAQMLVPLGWKNTPVKNQPRITHPDSLVTLSITSAHNVGKQKSMPITNPKGSATRNALARNEEGTLFNLVTDIQRFSTPPLYFIVYERVEDNLNIEISQPCNMDSSNCIDNWTDRIILPTLTLNTNPFEHTPQTDQIFEVPVEQIG